MKTTINKMIMSDKYNALWFKLDGEKLWGRRYPDDKLEDEVKFEFSGYVGKDPNGYHIWMIKGIGYGFLVKAMFYREDDYNNFVESIASFGK
jgi:hypothetical protein